MRSIAALTVLLAGCHIDVIDCIDLGAGCEPPALDISGPRLADNQGVDGVAIDGSYRLTVRNAYDGLDVDDAEHTDVDITDQTIDVRGRSEGQDHLRITSGESTATHWIDVHRLDRIALMPRELAFASLDQPPPHALLAGADSELVIQLSSAEGDRLVDQSLVIESDLVAAPTAWDAVTVRPETAFALDVVSADRAYVFTEPVVTGIEGIVPLSGGDISDPAALDPSTLSLVCFAGVAAGLHVAGLDWEITGVSASTPVNGSLDAGGCVHLSYPQDGEQLTVRAGDVERTFTLTLATP
jgi:hypothetical protein